MVKSLFMDGLSGGVGARSPGGTSPFTNVSLNVDSGTSTTLVAKIDVRWHTQLKEIIGDNSRLTKLRIINNQTGAEEEMSVDGAFIFIGLVPNTGFLKNSGVLLDRWGFIVTGHALLHQKERPVGFENRDPFLQETSLPGIFAAGDVRDKSTKQVVSAAGEGGSVALMIREYLKGT